MTKIWFTSDTHICHKNILRYQSQRIDAMSLKDENDIENHDNYIITMWNNMVDKHDLVYILGDFIMANQETCKKIISQLNGKKYLILGNHDSSLRKQGLKNYFEWVGELKEVVFRKELYNFLTYDLYCFMCHFPMKSWQNKARGSLMLYGHTHCNSQSEMKGDDLEFNVGLDNPLGNYKLFSLEDINNYYMSKLNGLTPQEYIEKVTKENSNFIR